MALRRSLPWLLCMLSGAACSAVGAGGYGVIEPGDAGGGDGGRRNVTNARDGAAGTTDGGAASIDGATATADGGASTVDGATAPIDVASSGGDDAASGADDAAATGDGGAGCVAREACGNGLDDDCNGVADDNCACVPGTTQRCYGGAPGNAGRGACSYGMTRCEGTGEFGRWTACEGWGRPMAEVCGNATDDDCDGMIDEGCACRPGETRACYSGSADTRGVGACRAGMQTCTASASGADWGPCEGEVLPSPDRCDGMDRDCDGNPNTGCVCAVGTTRSCYGGPSGTANVGLCRAGVETCQRDKMSGGTGWGACTGQVTPATDTCDGMDRDCDGNPNTGCACTVGATRPCYGGPPGTQDVGACRAGTQRCESAGGAVAWGTCTGEARPAASETCGNNVDDNCNGTADEGCVTCLPPRRMCPSGCTDVLTDRNNCGACGNVCPSGQACANGVCVGDGMLRITMTWGLAGDVDLHVVPPCGTEIYFGRSTACGGQLDRDDTSTTGPENVFWAAAPPRGTYLVCATPYSIRGSTSFTVTVNQGATVLRRWTGTRTSSSGYVLCSRTSPYFLGDFTL